MRHAPTVLPLIVFAAALVSSFVCGFSSIGLQRGQMQPGLRQTTLVEKQKRFLFQRSSSVGDKWDEMFREYYHSHFSTSNEKKNDLPVGGSVWPDSVFWTWVEVGTPPLRVAATVDSGSTNLNIPGVGCEGCPPANGYNQRYDPSASTTSQDLNLTWSNVYGTCDPLHPSEGCLVNGSLYMDLVGFPLPPSNNNNKTTSHSSSSSYFRPNIRTHVVEYQSANYYQGSIVQGVVGMSPSNYPPNETVVQHQCSPPPSSKNNTPFAACTKYVWGLCLHPGPNSNGTLTIGGADPSLAEDGEIQYANVGENIESSVVNASWIAAAGKKLSTLAPWRDNGTFPWPTLVDTGTNNFIVPGQFYWPLWSHICQSNSDLKHCYRFGFEPNFCAELTEEEIDAYPPFELHLDYDHQAVVEADGINNDVESPKKPINITLSIPPQAYFVRNSPLASSPKVVCNGIAVGADGKKDALMIVGDVALRDSYVVWDYANQRMGWGRVNKTNCGQQRL